MNRTFFSLPLKKLLLASCTLSWIFVFTPMAYAAYNPPPDQKTTTRRSDSGTTRTGSCGNIEGTPLTLLAPQTHIGQASSSYPTFAWFIPDSKSFKMVFRLFEDSPEGLKNWGEPIELDTKPGIMSYSLPQDQPGLVVGNTYTWQVTIVCDPDSPAKNVVAESKIKILPQPTSLAKEGLSPLDYAKESFWYSALEKALKSAPDSQLNETGFNLVQSLAEVEEERICSTLPENFAKTNCSTLLDELVNLEEEQLCLALLEESSQTEEAQMERKCELIDTWEWLGTWRWIRNLQQIVS